MTRVKAALDGSSSTARRGEQEKRYLCSFCRHCCDGVKISKLAQQEIDATTARAQSALDIVEACKGVPDTAILSSTGTKQIWSNILRNIYQMMKNN